MPGDRSAPDGNANRSAWLRKFRRHGSKCAGIVRIECRRIRRCVQAGHRRRAIGRERLSGDVANEIPNWRSSVGDKPTRRTAADDAAAAVKDMLHSVRAAKQDFTARRYAKEADLQPGIGRTVRNLVRRTGAESDRHRTRSRNFFYAMLCAQAGVTVAAFALARSRKSWFWAVAGMAGVVAISFGAYVYVAFDADCDDAGGDEAPPSVSACARRGASTFRPVIWVSPATPAPAAKPPVASAKSKAPDRSGPVRRRAGRARKCASRPARHVFFRRREEQHAVHHRHRRVVVGVKQKRRRRLLRHLLVVRHQFHQLRIGIGAEQVSARTAVGCAASPSR